VYHTLHDLGLRTTGQVAAHSWRRWRTGASEWAARRPRPPAVLPGLLERVEVGGHGATFFFSDATLEVLVPAPDVVRLSWGPCPDPAPYAASVPAGWQAPPVTVSETAGGGRVVAGGALEVEVSASGEVRLARASGGVVRHQRPPLRMGGWWQQRYAARPGERFSGLGEQAGGVDLRGGSYRLWNRDPGGAWGPGRVPLYLGIPVVLSTHPEGNLLSFYDNHCSARFEFPPAGAEGDVSVSFFGGTWREYLVVGEPSVVLERYGELTGPAALPPRWALGYHQSRWGYRNERHVREVLDGYRARGIPLSAVHLDIDYMRGYQVFTVDHRRFPDLGRLAERAGAQGVRLVAIVDPAVKVDPGYPLYRQAVEEKRLCTGADGEVAVGVVWPGRAAFPDFTAPATRAWWAAQYRLLTDAGVGGVWHDMNEPTSISLVGDPTLPLSTRHDLEGLGGDHALAHNVYGRLMNEAGYDGLSRARPHARPFVLSRSGWAGNQRWAWTWTGDVETTWAGLRQQVATVVGLGLSGIPFAGSDIGGFAGVPDGELYLRWLQMSVFMALCRTHSVVGAPRREPWRFPEPARGAIADWITFRYRLLPYLYTLAHEAAVRGTPLVRPTWWAGHRAGGEGGDAGAGADDSFLVGDDLFVAPVTAPGSPERAVRLPPGEWHPLWAADPPGARTGGAVLETPLERIPVLGRGGSIVALDDGWARPGACVVDGDEHLEDMGAAGPPTVAGDHAPRALAFHCWPAGAVATGTCVDDAGDGDGPVRSDELNLEGAEPGGTIRLRWLTRGGFPRPRHVRVVVHGWTAESALADGRVVPVRGGSVQCAPFDELHLVSVRPG
jgi:alpha-glucosidase